MRRITWGLIWGLVALLAGSWNSTSIGMDGLKANAQDNGIARLEKHTLELRLGEKQSLLDQSTRLQTAPILIRRDMVYFPVRALEVAGVAEVNWQADQKQANIASIQTVDGSLKELGLRAQSDEIYKLDGLPHGAGTLTYNPFTYQGRMYVSIDLLSKLGIRAEYAKEQLTLQWRAPHLEFGQREQKTDKELLEYTLLYEEGIQPPQLLAIGAAGSGTVMKGQVEKKAVRQGDATYNRIRFSLALEPGLNLYELDLLEERLIITVEREPGEGRKESLRFTEEGRSYLILDQPGERWAAYSPGDRVKLSGKLLRNRLPDGTDLDDVTMLIYRYTGQAYEEWDRVSLGVNQGNVHGEYSVSEQGHYLFQIISPTYTIDQGKSTRASLWAEFKATVMP
ncbi:hypothetical protein [Paenibacillus sp. SYP-B4298]|uniref:hypothetical protein n=1 Tax=Paenibacillus sp. SYP-B4298 TaxID=2996034 RepID=UPI0022DCF7D7|nr:hypothetical protein [Paenibacillus sp. SYP-B4298]